VDWITLQEILTSGVNSKEEAGVIIEMLFR